MKTHTNKFKNQIKTLGREITARITYGDVELGSENLNSISLNYESELLKSVMKQLNINSNVNIPLNSILMCEFGMKIDGEYEYINLGNFIVYSIEKQEDDNTYNIECYDKMLYSMVSYTSTGIEFPCTVREYIKSIADKLGLSFKNNEEEFVNYDKIINQELFLDANGNDIGFTFRDVLDDLSEVTASNICINDNDELEIRYINETNETFDEEFLKNINVKFGEKYGPINSIVLSRSGDSDNIYIQDQESIQENGICELKIRDNQLMNDNDRDIYLQGILNEIDGLEFYINDYSSTGIIYLEPCDKYTITVGENSYNCVIFNDEINITQGLEENIYTNIPDKSETNYKKADTTDKRINQAYIIVDKQLGEINSKIQKIESNNYEELINTVETKVTSLDAALNVISTNIDKTNGNINEVTTTTGFKFNQDGLNISKDGEPTKSKLDEAGMEITDSNSALEEMLFYSGYVNSDVVDKENSLEDYEGKSVVFTKDLIVKEYITLPNGRFENVYNEKHGKGIGLFM